MTNKPPSCHQCRLFDAAPPPGYPLWPEVADVQRHACVKAPPVEVEQMSATIAALTEERDMLAARHRGAAERVEELTGEMERLREEEFRRGVKEAFDYLCAASVNHYHGDPETDKICQIEAQYLDSIADGMLEDLAPDWSTKWKDLTEALKSKNKAETNLAEARAALRDADRVINAHGSPHGLDKLWEAKGHGAAIAKAQEAGNG